MNIEPSFCIGSSAFWFCDHAPEIWTEIDVFEIGGGAPGHERSYHKNTHVFHTPEQRRHWNVGGTWEASWDLAEAFRVYGLEWDRDEDLPSTFRIRYVHAWKHADE